MNAAVPPYPHTPFGVHEDNFNSNYYEISPIFIIPDAFWKKNFPLRSSIFV